MFAGHPLACQREKADCPAERVLAPGAGAVPRAKLQVHLIADADRSVGIVAGYGQIDAAAVAAAVEFGTHRDVDPDKVTVDMGRFPSAKLADYIRARDLTCRFPGCDVPAWNTDIDHTVPYPAGPTHPSNL